MTKYRDDELLFDLLVDGALAGDERRAFLLRLDALPDGWRRCALAFIESQAWGEAMSTAAVPRPGVIAGEPRGLRAKRPDRILAIAALLLASFALGFLARGRQHGEGVEPVAAPVREPRDAPLIGSPDGAQPVPHGEVRIAGQAVLELERGGEAGRVALPVVEGADPEWVSELPPIFTPTMARAIERRGHVVRVSRQIVEVSVGGGRTLLIPVDELRVADARWRL